MHHQPGRLVEHDQVGVLIQDIERNALGCWTCGDQGRGLHGETGAGPYRLGRIVQGHVVAQHRPFLHEGLDAGARQRADSVRQEPVRAQPERLRPGHDFDWIGHRPG